MKLRLLATTVVLLFLTSISGLSPVLAAPDSATVNQAVDWLRSQQQADGGFAGFSGSTDPGTTADVVLAIASAGVDPNVVSDGGPSLVDFLRSQADSYGSTVGGSAKLSLAAVASGENPRDFGGRNLVQTILSHLDPSTGLFDSQLFVHAYGMLALSAANQIVPEAAVAALEQRQTVDGGWAFSGSTDAGQADSNTTAVAIEALVASGHRSSSSIAKALDYLSGLTTSDGLYAYQQTPGTPLVGDANSTALVIQALLATGQSVDSPMNSSTIAALETLRNSDSGAFYFRTDAPDDNLLATAQAVPALEGKALPIWPIHTPGRTLDQARTRAMPGDTNLCIFFEQTGHNACNGFMAYWQHFGGVDNFGYPVTEEFTFVDPTTGRPTTMQYFQRARFEWHPGSDPGRYDVQLGLLGSEMLLKP